jgi:hypothetical protein
VISAGVDDNLAGLRILAQQADALVSENPSSAKVLRVFTG